MTAKSKYISIDSPLLQEFVQRAHAEGITSWWNKDKFTLESVKSSNQMGSKLVAIVPRSLFGHSSEEYVAVFGSTEEFFHGYNVRQYVSDFDEAIYILKQRVYQLEHMIESQDICPEMASADIIQLSLAIEKLGGSL